MSAPIDVGRATEILMRADAIERGAGDGIAGLAQSAWHMSDSDWPAVWRCAIAAAVLADLARQARNEGRTNIATALSLLAELHGQAFRQEVNIGGTAIPDYPPGA